MTELGNYGVELTAGSTECALLAEKVSGSAGAFNRGRGNHVRYRVLIGDIGIGSLRAP